MDNILVNISFVSKLPLLGDSPKVTIYPKENFEHNNELYKVYFIDNNTREILSIKECKINETVYGEKQWFVNWLIKVYNSKNILLFSQKIDLTNKFVFIKIDAHALGDNIAWMPYIEEFRVKNKCYVICSTFFNYLFEKEYSEILFALPNTQISNVYAQYYIGANLEVNEKYCPVISTEIPLQFVATNSLGLYDFEIKPKITTGNYISNYAKNNYGGKYICISEHASSISKEWKFVGGWQIIVDFLTLNGYKVVVISKENTELKNVINKTGNLPLTERIKDLKYAKMFIGVSSGLSWLSWAVGTHVVMISDVTPNFHEFKSNITRIGGENLKKVDYDFFEISSVKKVISQLKNII